MALFERELANPSLQEQPIVVLDACAAPGNKTSHAASFPFVRRVVALDRSEERSQILRDRMHQLGCASSLGRGGGREVVEVYNVDFLTLFGQEGEEGQEERRGKSNKKKNKKKEENSSHLPHQLNEVTHILLDPSCSGSGMNHIQPTSHNQSKRLHNLSTFQKRAILQVLNY